MKGYVEEVEMALTEAVNVGNEDWRRIKYLGELMT